MELRSKELNSDLGNGFVPKTIADFLQEVSVTEDGKKLAKLDEYVSELEKEMKKINVFKRELPVCMLLLGDAIDRLKGEVVLCSKGRKGKAVVMMEEFIPLGVNCDDERGGKMSGDLNEKKNWMSSAQLWTTPVEYDSNFDRANNKIQDSSSVLYHKSKKNQEGSDGMGQKTQLQSWSVENRGGAFVPFKKRCPKAEDDDDYDDDNDLAVDGLSLSPPVARARYGFHSSFSAISQQQRQEPLGHQQQQPKKQRRSWSPDLHRRFVSALEQLGGAQEATPKQIRELMQVADLTNDEVKSHLQKYRLHVRKMASASSGAAVMDLNLDILGRELNNSPQQKFKTAQSGSPQGPLHSSKGISVSLTIGESMEDEDDEKSESHSWKGRTRSR